MRIVWVGVVGYTLFSLGLVSWTVVSWSALVGGRDISFSRSLSVFLFCSTFPFLSPFSLGLWP